MLTLRCATLSLLVIGISTPVVAGDLYKWKDKDGIQHFSSTPPKTQEDFSTVELPVDPKKLVTMRKTGTNHEPEYVFFNNTWGPVELELSLTEADNVQSEPVLPAQIVLPAQTEKRLLKIKAKDPGQTFSFRFAYQSMIGPPLTQLPTEVDYYPPFPQGLEFVISQGFDNDQTHDKPPNQFAIDIVMPIGTPVLAARGGKVIGMQDGFHGAGQSERYLTRSN